MNEEHSTLTVPAFADRDSCCSDTRCCPAPVPVIRAAPKMGRNDPCPCESGRKFKKCCGQ